MFLLFFTILSCSTLVSQSMAFLQLACLQNNTITAHDIHICSRLVRHATSQLTLISEINSDCCSCQCFAVPGPPSFLNVETPSLESVTLQWGPPLQNNGRLVGYTLKYQPGEHNAVSDVLEVAPKKTPKNKNLVVSLSCSQRHQRAWTSSNGGIPGQPDHLHSGKPQFQHALQVLLEREDNQGLRPLPDGGGGHSREHM